MQTLIHGSSAAQLWGAVALPLPSSLPWAVTLPLSTPQWFWQQEPGLSPLVLSLVLHLLLTVLLPGDHRFEELVATSAGLLQGWLRVKGAAGAAAQRDKQAFPRPAVQPKVGAESEGSGDATPRPRKRLPKRLDVTPEVLKPDSAKLHTAPGSPAARSPDTAGQSDSLTPTAPLSPGAGCHPGDLTSPAHRRKNTLLLASPSPIKVESDELVAVLGAASPQGSTEALSSGVGGSSASDAVESQAPAAEVFELDPVVARNRAAALNEIIQSELSYIQQLQRLVGVFMEPLWGTPNVAWRHLSRSTGTGRVTMSGQGKSSGVRNLLGSDAEVGDSDVGQETSAQRAARRLLTEQEHKYLFGGVETLIPLHQRLMSQFRVAVSAAESSLEARGARAAVDTGGARRRSRAVHVTGPASGHATAAVTADMAPLVCMGSIFLRFSHFFKVSQSPPRYKVLAFALCNPPPPCLAQMYSMYVANHASANELLGTLVDTNSGFAQWMQSEEVLSNAGGQSLQSFLIMPVQRVPRYELLLSTLLKHTPEHLPDHADLLQAQRVVKEAASAINHNITLFLTQKAVLQIQRCLVPEPEPSLVSPSRRFVREGVLQKVTGSNLREYKVFLFNDLLVYGSYANAFSALLPSVFNRGRRPSAVAAPQQGQPNTSTPKTPSHRLLHDSSGEEVPEAQPTAGAAAAFSGVAVQSEAGGGSLKAHCDSEGTEEQRPRRLSVLSSTGLHSVGLEETAAAGDGRRVSMAEDTLSSQELMKALTDAVTSDSDKARQRVKLHNILYLEDAEDLPDVEGPKGYSNVFRIIAHPKNVTLVAESASEKQAWLRSLAACLAGAQQGRQERTAALGRQ